MDLVVSGILNFLTEQEAIGKADEVHEPVPAHRKRSDGKGDGIKLRSIHGDGGPLAASGRESG